MFWPRVAEWGTRLFIDDLDEPIWLCHLPRGSAGYYKTQPAGAGEMGTANYLLDLFIAGARSRAWQFRRRVTASLCYFFCLLLSDSRAYNVSDGGLSVPAPHWSFGLQRQ